MPLENLSVDRICLHEVYQRSDDGNVVAPAYGDGLLELDVRAMEAFRSRVIAAFKSSSQCIDMAIRDYGPGSAVEVGATLSAARSDDRFVAISRALADALATAQSSRNIPGGLLVVFDGTVGEPSRKFFAIMKAELHAGFIKTPDLRAEFVSELFLSPKTKLYKIGIFISDGQRPRPDLPDGWQPIVYDSQMTASQRDSAATYFHSTFLGLSLPENAAQRVKQFYQKTKDFIRKSELNSDEKVDLINGLYSYLKVDRARTIQVSRFAEQFMDDDLGDDYRRHMRRERFPLTAIEKDLSEISGSLRSRRLRFPRSITLSGPPDAMTELVKVTSGHDDDGTSTTQITIRGEIESQD